MSAVGHYLEDEGIATTGISLVREHSEAMRPPRALWVPFMLGRPLGAADHPAFQRDVLRSALALLDRTDVPVLQDFDPLAGGPAGRWETAGDAMRAAMVEAIEVEDATGQACPVDFSRPRALGDAPAARAAALQDEIAQLRPWHDLAVRRRGGSTTGLAGPDPADAAALLLAPLGPAPPPAIDAQALKLACDDLRAFYEEAALAQPGRLSPGSLADWYYRQTVVGDVLAALRRTLLDHPDPATRFVAERVLIPRSRQRPD